METTTARKRVRKKGSDMTLDEIKQLDFLNAVQAAKYCGMAPRTFYYYLAQHNITKYVRQVISKRPKVLYSRADLDEQLRPMTLPKIIKQTQIKEQNASLTTKKRTALRPLCNTVTALQRAPK